MKNIYRDDQGRFSGEGKKVNKNTVISVGYPVDVYEKLKLLPNRSEYIRKWVIEGMIRDGYLSSESGGNATG